MPIWHGVRGQECPCRTPFKSTRPRSEVLLDVLWSQVAQELVGNVSPEIGFALLLAAFILIFGSRNALNLAPVVVFGCSAFVGWWLLAAWFWPPLPAVALSMLLGTLMGVVVDHLSFGPLGRADHRLAPLIAAVAFAGAIEGLAPDRGSAAQPTIALPTLVLPWPPVSRLSEGGQHGLMLTVLLALFWGARWLLGRTHHGRAARAIADDRQAAYLLGVDVERTVTLTCVVAAALGAAAAVLAMTSIHAVR